MVLSWAADFGVAYDKVRVYQRDNTDVLFLRVAAVTPLASNASASGPDWLTRSIALAGLAVALVSLGWQVVAYIGSGSRVRIEVKYGIFLGQGPIPILTPEIMQLTQNPSNVDTAQPIYLPDELVAAMGTQNLRHYWLIAEIANVGRLPVTVQECQWHTIKSGTIGRRPDWPGTSLPHRLEAHDQCIAVMDLNTIISVFDAPFGDTKTSGRMVWPVIRLGNRRVVNGKRIEIPVTLAPGERDHVANEQNSDLRFRLVVTSVSHVVGRSGTLVSGHIEQGAVRVGDVLQLVAVNAPDFAGSRQVRCIAVGEISEPNRDPTQPRAVGVLVEGVEEEEVYPGNILQAVLTGPSSRRGHS